MESSNSNRTKFASAGGLRRKAGTRPPKAIGQLRKTPSWPPLPACYIGGKRRREYGSTIVYPQAHANVPPRLTRERANPVGTLSLIT